MHDEVGDFDARFIQCFGKDRLDNALRKITNHPNYQKDPTT